jgi:ribonuclease HI
MGEPWLRGKDETWVPSPQEQGVYNITVHDLMRPNEKMWDKEKVESLFTAHIAKSILNVPLFSIIEEDKLVWAGNTHGDYSVKSGYNLMLNFSGRFQSLACNGNWNCLWKIHAPPKAKHLLWRICRGCLPTRTRLQDRCVSCPLSCPLCDHNNEDDWHVVFGCEVSVQSRQTVGLQQFLLPWLQPSRDLCEIILDICASDDKYAAGQFATLVWVLWSNRNNSIWNDTKEQGIVLGHKARHIWEEWFSVQQVQLGQQASTQQSSVLQWQKPSERWYKCNIDAGFHRERNKTSGGWCLRDHTGMFVAAGTSWLEGVCSVIEGESIALLHALNELVQRGVSHAIFETDSKSLVDAIQHIHVGVSDFSLIVRRINNVLSLNPNFMVRFVKRQANIVAHTLARAAISWPRRCNLDSLPLCISSLLHNEII